MCFDFHKSSKLRKRMPFLTNKEFVVFFQLRNIGEKIRRLVFKRFVKTCRDLDIRKQINHHLHITLTEFSYPSEELEIYFSLYSTKENCYVSEKVLMPALPSSENNDQGLFTIFVAFCSFFTCSLTVVHKGRPWKRRGRQWKSSRAGQQNNFFIFQPDFNVEISPKNATKHPVA